MKILVFGSGAIGSAFGGFLSQTSHEVILYGRGSFVREIARKGLRVGGIWGRHRFSNFKVATKITDLQKYKKSFDLVLFTVKSFDSKKLRTNLKKLHRRKR